MPNIVIVGAGFAGICMGIRLKQAGIHSFVILEQASRVGGTWRDNVYPGCACDVQSHLYSFSFEPNPGWTRMFAERAEIYEYLERCVDKYGLRRHIRFDTRVSSARWDAARRRWAVALDGGEELHAAALVTATGGLSRPSYPAIPGLESFAGKLFHSARWDHAYSLEGKRVGVIGTGASAIQFVPQIVPRVQQLTLFQRTPPWILPKPDRAIPPRERALYRSLPHLQWLRRASIYWQLETRVLGFVVDPRIMHFPQRAAERYLEHSVRDPELRRKLTPSFLFGCKRVLLSNDYYPSLTRPNVEVVTESIRAIEPQAVITADGRRQPLDALILGTGFQASESMAPFAIHGSGGVELNAHWAGGAEAYLGMTIHGFPNLFVLYGPNTSLGHSSLVFMFEAQCEHVLGALRELARRGASSVEVRPRVQEQFNDRLQARLRRSVWASGCSSWYQTASGKNTTIWPGFTFEYRRRARFHPEHFAFT